MDQPAAEPEVLVETRGAVGFITLNRPKSLNALTLDQIRAITPQLRAWARDPAIAMVIQRGNGEKAFSAGGDIRALYDACLAKDWAAHETFFGEEYTLNHLIGTYPKPFLSVIHGIVMGGGFGLSVHGAFRVATETTMFAMPETGIGMIPDVGGSYVLSRMPGKLGLYLGLTGARCKLADALYTGVATHFVPQDDMESMIDVLVAQAAPGMDAAKAETIIGDFSKPAPPAPLAEHRAVIDRIFAAPTVEAVITGLEAEGGDWAQKALSMMAAASPWSLKVVHRQLTEAAGWDFAQGFAMELRLACRMMQHPDFVEGVRAKIVDKDNAPRWSATAPADVRDEDVAAALAPFNHRDDLTF